MLLGARPASDKLAPSAAIMDVLSRSVEFGYHATFFPLGFPLTLRSNDRRVITAGEDSWGEFSRRFDEPPLDLRVAVGPQSNERLPRQPMFRAQGNLTTIVSDRFNFATLDYKTGLAFGWIQEAVAAESAYFRWHFLEAMAYCLLTERHLTPIHAGCVARDGRSILLLGDSGAGKSTLAFGCARLGWAFVSDDAVFMLRRDANRRVLGLPYRARLRPDVVGLFPELGKFPSGVGPNGKATVDVSLPALPGVVTTDDSEVAACVFLKRDDRQREATMTPLDSDNAYERIAAGLVVYDEQPRVEQLASLRRLVVAPCYELRYGRIEPAADTLQRLL